MSVNTDGLRVQVGQQVDYTTQITPTSQLRGVTDIKLRSDNDIGVLDDMALGFAGGDSSVVRSIGGSGSMSGWLSYEDAVYLLENMFGAATPTGSGPYVRVYNAPVNAPPTPKFWSLVDGESTVGAYALVGAMQRSMTWKFETGKEATFASELVGNKIVPDTLESLTVRPVYPVMANQITGIYWDDWGGTIGTTALPGCDVRMIELKVEPSREPRACFGTNFRNNFVERRWAGSLKVSLEFNGTTKTDVDAIMAGTITKKLVRVVAADTANRNIQIDFTGTVEDDIEIFGDDDGVVTVDVTLGRTYNAALATWLKITATNEVATIV